MYVCDFDTMEKIGKMDVFATRMDQFRKNKSFSELVTWMKLEESDPGVHHGIIENYGKDGLEQRRFALRHLKDFGFGKSSMETLIADEAKELIEDIKTEIKFNNEVKMNGKFNLAIVNALWKIITGKRLDLHNPEDQHRMQDLADFFASFAVTGFVSVVAFRLPAWLAKKIPQLKSLRETYQKLFEWFDAEYKEHEQTFDENSPRDFLDAYIAERKRADNENDVNSSFYGARGNQNYLKTLFDLFLAGSETTSTTLTYAVLFMLHDPEPWKKAQAELDEVVGRSRLPTLDDRPNLPYFEALISELMRRSNVAPFAVFHSNHQDAVINQYKIPANSLVNFTLSEVLNDPKYFPEPDKFKPERFIVYENGKMVYKPHPALVYFGIGKRECLGKSLAKLELFIFLSNLVHTFKFEPTKDGFPGLDDCHISVTRCPRPFSAKISMRD